MKALASSWKHQPFSQGVALAFHATFNDAELARIEAGLIPRQTAADAPDLNYHSRLLEFLISNLLLGQSKPFPRPAGMVEPAPGV